MINPSEDAQTIGGQLLHRLGRKVSVMIVDTDKTYSFRNFHFTPRPKPMAGITSHGGIIAYIAGRALKLRRRPTPLAVAGAELAAEEALTIANVADRARGPGCGATVWDMAAKFKVSTTEVTWDMLAKDRHKPVVVVRRAAVHNTASAGQKR
jgi:F420-0:gamma-glutamyl ligase-like protein